MSPELAQLARRIERDEHFRAACDVAQYEGAARIAIAIAAELIRAGAFQEAGRIAALSWTDPLKVGNIREHSWDIAQRIYSLQYQL